MSDDKDDKDNVMSLVTKKDKEFEEGQKARLNILDNWDKIIEELEFSAKIMKAEYDSLILAGFLPEQAVVIVAGRQP